MRVLVFGHAYAASYNRRDKLDRLANHPDVEELAVVVPNKWHDRMMNVDRFYEKTPEDDSYKVYLLDVVLSGSQSKHFFLPWQLNNVVQEFDPDVIHVENELHDWVLGEIAWLNSLRWKKKLVSFSWENIRRDYDPLSTFCRKYNLAQIDSFIGGNTEAVKIAKEDGYKKSTSVIPQFGVDAERFYPEDVSQLRRQHSLQDRFVIGFAARYVKEKGIYTLVEAIEKLVAKKDLPKFSLVMLSSMPVPDWLQKKIDQFPGIILPVSNVPHEDFPKYMNLFDVLVLPSETQKNWKEQFGRVMIEAMACGVPVVGSSSGAIPEVISDKGVVFKEKDAKDLAIKISELMVNLDELGRLKSEVRQYVLDNYTHDVVVDRTVDVWKNSFER